MSNPTQQFWQTKPLHKLSKREWESLCDGCGRCCRIRLQDERTDEIHLTVVSCRLLNTQTCRCSDYQNRQRRVPGCLNLHPPDDSVYKLLPDTCAYRLLYEGKQLPEWHPLVSGTRETVHTAGISVAGKVISEKYIHPDELENHLIEESATFV